MITKCPLVSIITPSYNQAEFIEETILSVKNQDYPAIEHIIIDNCSDDGTIEILNKYGPLLKWISEPDHGQTNAINKGLNLARGEILAYLNADDIYEPRAIQAVVDFFINNPSIDMVYGDVIHISRDSDFLEIARPGKIIFEDYLTGEVYLPQPGIFFRKKIPDQIGYFDEDLDLAMDLDYWIRIFLNFKTEYLPKNLARFRLYPQSKSGAKRRDYLNEKLYILKKTFSKKQALLFYFGTLEKVRQVRDRACGYVHFFGGLEYLRNRQFRESIIHITRGIHYQRSLIYDSYFFWSLIVAIFGKKITDVVKEFLPKKLRVRRW